MKKRAQVAKSRSHLLLAVAGTLALGAVLLDVVTIYLRSSSPGSTLLDVLKVSGPIVVGVGAAVGLVVAYRRQRYLEDDEVGKREAYAQAAQQLGDTVSAVRLAGVYAMAKLADDWPANRQQCVDVLCAYLRLPWVVDSPGLMSPTRTTVEQRLTGGPRVMHEYAGQVGEAEVRRTLVRVLTAHLQIEPVDKAAIGWRGLDFDFTGATFPDYTNFKKADLSQAIFTRATFGDHAWFPGAMFGDHALFGMTRFGDRAWFGGTSFGDRASFGGATFGKRAVFGYAVMGDRTMLGGEEFNRATFGDRAVFDGTTFGEDAYFREVKFGKATGFIEAAFGTGEDFRGATRDGKPYDPTVDDVFGQA